jgi:4-carboxymuconolactone decarboxylase
MGGSRNEKIAECGLRNGNVRSLAGSELDPQTVALVRAAAALAEGRIADLKQRFLEARAAGVPDRWVEELLLQSLLLVGYPLALVGFGVWREVTSPLAGDGDDGGGGPGEALSHEDWQSWAERGAQVCAVVYGRTYHKLLLNLRSLHPALEDLVLVDAYGKVIGRPGLDMKRRELCTVAAIAVLGTARQLHSHLRGALNTGATPAEVEAVLASIDGDLDLERRRRAREQWEDVKKRKL